MVLALHSSITNSIQKKTTIPIKQTKANTNGNRLVHRTTHAMIGYPRLMISIATKHPVEYGSTMSMTDCAVVTDDDDMLLAVALCMLMLC